MLLGKITHVNGKEKKSEKKRNKNTTQKKENSLKKLK